MNTVG